ncbi:transglutaminase domain-containing protein [Bacillus sp. cl95]|uniref:DUF4129 domain-containing transglutaminase family protein n=2 Tax=unclassified Bacillus (in: firmicutes) TaxID=185979 RepID=UPI0020C8C865|nr:transglutaminase domain-containing protein [Bacillus sp. cl95]
MRKDSASLLLYVCGFLLLWEWLRPIEQLTQTDHIAIFIAFPLLALFLSYIEVNKIAQVLIKSLYVIYALYFIYFEGGFFNATWIGFFWTDLKSNFSTLLKADWYGLSDVFRSLLFFVLLWLMTYLIEYWLLRRKSIFIFFFLTLIYITVLDTFTVYKANTAIIRTIVIGFSVMGMLTFFRLITKEKLIRERFKMSKWMVPLAVMITVSVGIGFVAPKAAPIWPDPVPYLKSFSDQAGGGYVKKIGYGIDDSQLGGPFIGDDSIVYRIKTDQENYWKVESKDIYTGKGWEVSNLQQTRFSFLAEGEIPVKSFLDVVNVKENSASVMAIKNYDHIVYPLGLKHIDASFESKYEMDPNLEKIYSYDQAGNPVTLDEYVVQYDIPKYSVTELMKNSKLNSNLDAQTLSRYTQLPENLPQRVRDLALEITKDKKNWFDQARAIEKYFDSSAYTYDQKDVAVPKEDQDYVDQFLFETKKGYCDNFSSSMVVLLRSVGIPARWVKGYTEGEFKEYTTDEAAKKIYEITNNNAHSWVEVYFPNQGWVTFEPTKGFSNSTNFDFDQKTDTAGQSQVTPPVPASKPKQDRLDKLEQDTKVTKKKVTFKSILLDVQTFFKDNWKWFVLGMLVLIAAVGFVYSKRGKWMPYFLIYRFKYSKKDEHLAAAYLQLLIQLERYGLKRKKDQTLRNYARYVDTFFSTREMSKLTSKYEQYLYRQERTHGSWKETKELWENLIKKTIA